MTLYVYGEAFTCAKAEKGTDFVKIYDENGVCTGTFSGISDFSGYVPENGDWSEAGPSPQEDMDAMLVDHEYRLTLLELGVTEEV